MIVYSAVVAHNPLLLRENLADTPFGLGVAAVREELLASAPDVIVLLSAHAEHFDKVYTLYGGTNLATDLKQFGWIKKQMNFSLPVALYSRLLHAAKQTDIPLQMIFDKNLDYGSAVNAILLNLPENLPLLALGTSSRSLTDHAAFGYFLKDVLHDATSRVAIIVSGDGAHKHASDSPAGYSPQAEKFDQGLTSVLGLRSLSGLINLTKNNSEAEECLSKPLAISFGVLRNFPRRTRIHSYTVHHGIGLFNATLFRE